MKFSSLLILLFLLVPKAFGQMSFDNDTIINKLFNKDEIEDLEKILVFFEGEIERILEEKEVYQDSINLYKNYLDFISIPPENRDFNTFISIKEQLRFYDEINNSTFNKIWEFKTRTIVETKIEYKLLDYRYNGTYQLFLEQLGILYESFDNYYRTFKAMGCMSTSMWWHPILENKKYNIDDIKVQLFVAIHFLTINDQEKRNEKI